MATTGRPSRHQETVKALLTAKVVDFDAVGKLVSQLGPGAASADEPWEEFCGTMRHFIRIYRLTGPGSPLENLGRLGEVAGELNK